MPALRRHLGFLVIGGGRVTRWRIEAARLQRVTRMGNSRSVGAARRRALVGASKKTALEMQ